MMSCTSIKAVHTYWLRTSTTSVSPLCTPRVSPNHARQVAPLHLATCLEDSTRPRAPDTTLAGDRVDNGTRVHATITVLLAARPP